MTYVSRPNTWLAQDTASTTQLTYALQLNPAPLTVSVAGQDPVIGSLQFVVTNPTAAAIAVDTINFTVQIGTAGSNLTATTAGVGYGVSDSAWAVTPPATTTSGSAIWSLGPATGASVTLAASASVVLELYGFATVENTGNTTINVKEMLASNNGYTSFLVTTFPTGFFFNGLTATLTGGSQSVPVAQVAANATVDLTWNSSVVDTASVTIYYSNASLGQQSATPTSPGSWTSPALTSDTVFTVVVTASAAGGSPLSAGLTTVVSVQNPALIAASLAAGSATVTDAVSAGSASVGGTLKVSGHTTLNALTASGTLLTNGTIIADGAAIRNGVSIDSATVSTALTVEGTVSMLGNATMVASGATLSKTSVQANTDGFAVIQIVPPSSSSTTVYSYGCIYVGGNCFYVQGGVLGQSGNPTTMTIPIQSGTTWYYSASQADNNEENTTIQIWWFPLGTPASNSENYTISEASDHSVVPLKIQSPFRPKEERARRAGAFIDKLAEVFDKPLSEDARSELISFWSG